MELNIKTPIQHQHATRIGGGSGMADESGTVIPNIIIPPINSINDFSLISNFTPSFHQGMQTIEEIPKTFNWIDNDNGKNKSHLISLPGNQMLCGSCWAISAAAVISDNFVTKGILDYNPNLSTTYSLACYKQKQCLGGNPGLLLESISKNGIASNSCVDYSFCAETNCSGKADKHFKADGAKLNKLIPNCGCYDSSVEHDLFKIEKPVTIRTQKPADISKNKANIKKHIYNVGPIIGGFLVFKNFINGAWATVNNGIYFENANIVKGVPVFKENYANADTYVGSHAVRIIGWGEAESIVDNKGTRKMVPFWECVNSWTLKWGNNGRFRMAMYPFNKLSQFDMIVKLNLKGGIPVMSGGLVLIDVKSKPERKKFNSVSQQYENVKKLEDSKYYTSQTKITKIDWPKSKIKDPDGNLIENTSGKFNWSKIFNTFSVILLIILLVIGGGIIIYKGYKRFKGFHIGGGTNRPVFA